MGILMKARKFFTQDKKTMLLLLEAFIYLGWARLLICVPFSRIAPTLGKHMQETEDTMDLLNREDLKHVGHAIQIMSNHTIWESKCLVKAIAGMKMLEKRQIESTLYLGIARDETGKMIAHAWLRSGPIFITGKEGMERFTVVSKFAKQIGARNEYGKQL